MTAAGMPPHPGGMPTVREYVRLTAMLTTSDSQGTPKHMEK